MGLVFRILFFVKHSPESFWCSGSPRSPCGCIRRGKDGSIITHSNIQWTRSSTWGTILFGTGEDGETKKGYENYV